MGQSTHSPNSTNRFTAFTDDVHPELLDASNAAATTESDTDTDEDVIMSEDQAVILEKPFANVKTVFSDLDGYVSKIRKRMSHIRSKKPKSKYDNTLASRSAPSDASFNSTIRASKFKRTMQDLPSMISSIKSRLTFHREPRPSGGIAYAAPSKDDSKRHKNGMVTNLVNKLINPDDRKSRIDSTSNNLHRSPSNDPEVIRSNLRKAFEQGLEKTRRPPVQGLFPAMSLDVAQAPITQRPSDAPQGEVRPMQERPCNIAAVAQPFVYSQSTRRATSVAVPPLVYKRLAPSPGQRRYNLRVRADRSGYNPLYSAHKPTRRPPAPSHSPPAVKSPATSSKPSAYRRVKRIRLTYDQDSIRWMAENSIRDATVRIRYRVDVGGVFIERGQKRKR